MTIFQGTGRRMTKMNKTFSMGDGVSNTASKCFPQKSLYRLNESQKTSLRGIFSLTLGVLLG